ncbi:hypothetical protein [Brevibacillus agri]|uniref:hypothetical protein n=1 Tax=Brevibacillus agri TaxID=51101 RepID=UPI0028680F30|nr:hypothetical protein [Brevibacillus agri]
MEFRYESIIVFLIACIVFDWVADRHKKLIRESLEEMAIECELNFESPEETDSELSEEE